VSDVLPDFAKNGWELDDGEALNREFPTTFWIPDLTVRKRLQPGDLAKLIFRIAIDDPDYPVAVERMWVIVSERTSEGYRGVLDNEPTSLAENDYLWPGVELPFAAYHIIDALESDAKLRAALVAETIRRR